ncbi:MAG: hypothetical protein ABH873_10310 [Candidatus Firestonebacteria bacterium]
MKKLVLFIVLCKIVYGLELKEPSWLLTIPTASTLSKDQCSIGIFYLDLGIRPDLEIGVHGIKYNISYQDGSKLGIGASLIFGLYPYIVYTKNFDFGILSVGINPFPYFLFAGLEYKLSDEIKLIGEIHNGIVLGARNNLAKDWFLDLGAGLTVYPYKNYLFYDYANTDCYNYKFPNSFSPFLIISIYYAFNINPPPIPEVPKEKEPIDNEIKPIDPVRK